MNGRPTLCPGPVTRRTMLQVGGGLAGLGLADLLRARAETAVAQGSTQPETAVIFAWLPGGPPHLDMYDLKPDAPAEYRGDFRPIPTNVPGLDVCELFPLHAAVADKFALVRSIAHNFADHGGGHKRFLTGRDPNEPVGFVNDFPMVGSMASKLCGERNRGIPNYIMAADAGREGIDVFSFGAAYLGPSTYPFTIAGDPAEKNFKVQNLTLSSDLERRLDDRMSLLAGLDRLDRAVDRGLSMRAMDEFSQRAVAMLTSSAAREAFDLTKEPDEIRNRYGMHRYGQRCLMARRLVEAGATWVTIVLENPMRPNEPWPKDIIYNWDSHAVNGDIYKDARYRFPIYDQAISALVSDLYARGLDKRVLLVVTGEFGRTPRIESFNGRPGRDHWPQSMSLLLSGGGLKMGQVVGSTNSKGEVPKDRPLTPNDLWATVFHHLGIDWVHNSFLDHRGRPMPVLPYGDVISELV